MELLVGYTDLEDYIKENAGKIPSKVADEIMEQILMICDNMHKTELSTTFKRGRISKREQKRYGPKGKPKVNYCAHADFHNENIMIGVKDGKVNVVIIDPHKSSNFKVAEPWSDMTFVARHAIGLALTAEEVAADTARKAMKNVILTDLKKDHPRVYDFVRKCLGEKVFPKLV